MLLAAGKPSASAQTIAEVAAYKGPDRTERLIAGAKKEGTLHAIALPRPSMLSWYFFTGASETGFAGTSSARSAPGTANRLSLLCCRDN